MVGEGMSEVDERSQMNGGEVASWSDDGLRYVLMIAIRHIFARSSSVDEVYHVRHLCGLE